MYQSPINGLLSIQYDEEQAPKYKLYENLESGKLYEVDYNELPSMTGSYEYEFPVDGFFYLSLDGIRTAGDISKNYFIRDKYTSKDKIYYPEGIFSAFDTYIVSERNGNYYTSRRIGDLLTTFEKFDLNYVVSNRSINSFSISTSDSYDVYTVDFTNVNHSSNQEYYVSWKIIGKNNSAISGSLPELPSEIINEYSFLKRENLTMSFIFFEDYLEMNSNEYYDAFLKGLVIQKNQKYNYKSVSYREFDNSERRALSQDIIKAQFYEYINKNRR